MRIADYSLHPLSLWARSHPASPRVDTHGAGSVDMVLAGGSVNHHPYDWSHGSSRPDVTGWGESDSQCRLMMDCTADCCQYDSSQTGCDRTTGAITSTPILHITASKHPRSSPYHK